MGALKVWIGLSSKAGCGKSTIASTLEKDYGFARLSFAKRLKELCNELFPELMNQSKEDYRWVLQKFGTDYCRRIKDSVWVDILLKQLEYGALVWKHKHNPFNGIIVDDVRFYNEYFALKGSGFKMVRLVRNPELLKKAGYDPTDPHSSETQLDNIPLTDWDLVVTNNYEYPFNEAVNIITKAFGVKKI